MGIALVHGGEGFSAICRKIGTGSQDDNLVRVGGGHKDLAKIVAESIVDLNALFIGLVPVFSTVQAFVYLATINLVGGRPCTCIGFGSL
jgi:hypothetical protein